MFNTLGGSGVRVGVGGNCVGWLSVAVETTIGVEFVPQAEIRTARQSKASKALRRMDVEGFKDNLLNFVVFLWVAKAQPQIRFVPARVDPPGLCCFADRATRFVAVAAVVELAIRH